MLHALRLVTAGEVYGPGLTALAEGVPAGRELDRKVTDGGVVRGQSKHGRGERQETYDRR